VTDELTVVVEDERLLMRRGDSTVVVLAHKVRRLVHALVEGAARLVNGHMESAE
jgi:hypothetical protein